MEMEEKPEQTELSGSLSDLHVSALHELNRSIDRADELCPDSYRMNSPDELRLLALADSFQRQFSFLYPHRRPLLLCPVNEFGVKKFVSMTVRPSPSVHPELFTWEGCASFVANFLSLDLLEPPVDLPRYLYSPTTVLRTQRATCFESATLLCSLLLGGHYDAYCVSGYAARELCELDQSLQDCPLLEDTQDHEVTSEQDSQEDKYAVKPLRRLQSRFLLQQEKKKQEAAAALQRQNLQESVESPPADSLCGLRVHCWVLVLSGSRSVQQSFFIDPLTGSAHHTNDDNFLGIESLWNHLNYYTNMQDCSHGCAHMEYDLEDLRLWEPVLYGAISKKQLILDVLKKKESMMMGKISKDDEEEQQPRVFQMPRSWVSCVNISKKELQRRRPARCRAVLLRRAKLETFEPYTRADGLTSQLSTYTDLQRTQLVLVKERFQHRVDHLVEREVNKITNITTERFQRGHRFHLLFHRFSSVSADAERQMEFSSGRHDDLVRRVASPREMTEAFEGRSDFLFHRHVVFRDRGTLSHDPEADELLIEKVVERFHRDGSRPAGEAVAERVFLLSQRRVEVTYHLEEQRSIPSRRSFTKPGESTETRRAEAFSSNMAASFQVDPSVKPLRTLQLFEMLQALMKEEEEAIFQIKQSQKEVRAIVSCREQEEADAQLFFSPWTTAGAAQAHSKRLEMKRIEIEEQLWLQEKEEDILAPLLLRLSNTGPLSAADARQLHQDCLAEFKQRLVEHANLIQERYEKETKELQSKQQWYQQNEVHLTRKQRNEYHSYCSEKTLQIEVSKKRLSMHKEDAPLKYRVLDQRLRRDPRLAPHLLS